MCVCVCLFVLCDRTQLTRHRPGARESCLGLRPRGLGQPRRTLPSGCPDLTLDPSLPNGPPFQDLARPGVVERYVPSPEVAATVRGFFAGMWGLDDPAAPDTAAVLVAAAADPGAYVLKPQREGGGNNLYGDALAARVAQGGAGLAAYILMQRIQPPTTRRAASCLFRVACRAPAARPSMQLAPRAPVRPALRPHARPLLTSCASFSSCPLTHDCIHPHARPFLQPR